MSTPTPTFPALVKGFTFTLSTTDTSGNALPPGESETAATIGIRPDNNPTYPPGTYQYVIPLAAGVSSASPSDIAAALGKPLAPGNYWAAVDQTDSLNGSTATSAWTAEQGFSIPQPVVQPSPPSGFSAS